MAIPAKGIADHLDLGDWNSVCFECGRKMKASMLVKHWQGYWVCPEHWEPRHPQDFVKSVTDNQTVPWAQPQPNYVYTAVCDPEDMTAIVGYAVAGCVIVGFTSPFFDPQVYFDDVAPQ